MNIENLSRQSRLLNAMLTRAVNDEALFADLEDFGPVLKDKLRSLRVKIRSLPRRSQVPDRPIANAIVVVDPWFKSHKGLRMAQYHLTDDQGVADIAGLRTGAYPVAAYQVNPATGHIVYAPDLSKSGQQFSGAVVNGWMIDSKIRWDINEKIIVVFPCISRPFYSMIDPRYLRSFKGINIVDGSGVEPRQFGLARGLGEGEAVGVVFGPQDADEDDGIKMIIDNRMLLLNSEGYEDEDQARGRGYVLREESLIRTGMLAVEDMWQLNEARLRTLREHAIENQRLARLHQRGKSLIEKARQAEEARDWERYVKHVRAALGGDVPRVPGSSTDAQRRHQRDGIFSRLGHPDGLSGGAVAVCGSRYSLAASGVWGIVDFDLDRHLPGSPGLCHRPSAGDLAGLCNHGDGGLCHVHD